MPGSTGGFEQIMRVSRGNKFVFVNLTTFRWKPYVLAFGGYGGFGSRFEWLGISVGKGTVNTI